jgi:hypothetical protein
VTYDRLSLRIYKVVLLLFVSVPFSYVLSTAHAKSRMIDEEGRNVKIIVAYFKLLFQHFPAGI